MKIRSITYFYSIQWPLDQSRIDKAGEFIHIAQEAFENQGFEVQTKRLATAPFPLILREENGLDPVDFAVALEKKTLESGFDYASIGPALPSDLQSYLVIPEVLASTQNTFAAGVISSEETGIVPKAVRRCAEVIKKNSQISADGFGNLRFAALANVSPGSPFFPAAYHEAGSDPGFAIATEAADLAVSAIRKSNNLASARNELINSLEKIAHDLEEIGDLLAKDHGLNFHGIDFSLAPFPMADQSIGTAVEEFGVPGIGNNGSLAAVAMLAESLDRARYRKAGFNGVMLPVLEDTVLSDGAAAGMLTVNDLLLFAAVCGTGLDTIPLPGSISEDQIYAVLLDLAALAQRLGKPLTARLMPIPGKKIGDKTEFDFDFFANSRIMALNAQPLSGFLAEDAEFQIQYRNQGK